MVRYKLYPTLLNEFSRFENSFISEEVLINRINRVFDFTPETLEKFQRGVRFENAVLKDVSHQFNSKVIQEVRDYLPKPFNTQTLVQFTFEDIYFYGYADVTGEKRVVDLKTTSLFKEEHYHQNFQNLYLFGLKEQGFTSMEYVVYDFSDIHYLKYDFSEIDFNYYLSGMKRFTQFLEENRKQITDKKIFVATGGLFV